MIGRFRLLREYSNRKSGTVGHDSAGCGLKGKGKDSSAPGEGLNADGSVGAEHDQHVLGSPLKAASKPESGGQSV